MAVILGVLISSILAFYWMHEWAEGVYGGVDAFLMIIISSSLIIASLVIFEKYGQVVGFIPLIVMAVFFIYRKMKASESSVAKSSIAYYRGKVLTDPKNIIYRERLAEMLHDAGMLEQAIFELQTIVKMGGGIPIQSKLDKWISEKKTLFDGVPVCRWCGTENRAGELFCSKCGLELPYDSGMTRRLFAGRRTEKLLSIIIVGACTVVALTVLTMPFYYGFLPLVMGLLAYWGWQLVKGTRS